MSNTQLIEQLNGLLADEAVFYQKLRNFHWNVKGPAFFQLHDQFEQMYTASALQVDSIAERILALGGRPFSSMKEFLDNANLTEQLEVPNADGMVNELASDLKQLATATNSIRSSADGLNDEATINLLDELLDAHEKDAWMLRAWLG